MARVIVDLDSNTLEKIREILRIGNYGNIEEFIWVSVANQLHLESKDETEVMPDKTVIEDVNVDPLDLLTLNASGTDIELDEVPPNTEPLWGMYYRFLPLKVALRCIANIGRSPGREAFSQIGETALIIGERIRKYEKHMEIKRGYGNSQGFPGRRRDVKASINRYLNLYVGTTQKKTGLVSGMMPTVGFGTIRDGHLPVLSKTGLQFARLENPLIDKNHLDTPLGEEEKLFILEYVKKNMPGEYGFMETYYKALLNGANSPSDISIHANAYLRENLSGQTLTDSVLATMTSGVQSRMVELGLVTFERIGTSSRYEITDFGNAFFKEG